MPSARTATAAPPRTTAMPPFFLGSASPGPSNVRDIVAPVVGPTPATPPVIPVIPKPAPVIPCWPVMPSATLLIMGR